MEKTNFKELNNEYKELLLTAEASMDTAYNPYSNFYVGAAILSQDNEVIIGSNIENASWGLSICAERTAISSANAKGKRKFKAIAIIGKGKNHSKDEIITPCGACRQMLIEMSQITRIDFKVIMSNEKKDKIIIANISELLPLPFKVRIN
ncbi:cytidine deaminase [Patescibacteria group bacterium]|nr:cytidine deaminase [Patescibacteria group bacterium]